MLQELREAESAYFVTLTYDQENLPLVGARFINADVATLYKPDLQNFFKRLRKYIMDVEIDNVRFLKKSEKTGKWSPKLRYFACGEYGTKGDRPHYHVIMYNLPVEYVEWDPIHQKMYSEVIDEVWGKGITDIGEVERRSAHYVAKYTLDPIINGWSPLDTRQRPYAVMSRRPGIGLNYVDDATKNYYYRTEDCYTHLKNGVKQPIGRYYKEKIFTDENKLRNVSRKAIKYAKEVKRMQEDRIESSGGDIYKVRREQYAAAIRKTKRNLKEGKL